MQATIITRTTTSMRNPRAHGFTLLELMLVIAVISIVATVAIPGITHARRRANEASAISSLRTISSAQSQHRVRFGAFATVGALASSGLLDDNFLDSQKEGYVFEEAVAPTTAVWAVRATPQAPGLSGDRYFFIDASGVIRYSDTAAATVGDAAID